MNNLQELKALSANDQLTHGQRSFLNARTINAIYQTNILDLTHQQQKVLSFFCYRTVAFNKCSRGELVPMRHLLDGITDSHGTVIQAKVGLAEKTVRRTISELEEMELIHRECDNKSSPRYWVKLFKLVEADEMATLKGRKNKNAIKEEENQEDSHILKGASKEGNTGVVNEQGLNNIKYKGIKEDPKHTDSDESVSREEALKQTINNAKARSKNSKSKSKEYISVTSEVRSVMVRACKELERDSDLPLLEAKAKFRVKGILAGVSADTLLDVADWCTEHWDSLPQRNTWLFEKLSPAPSPNDVIRFFKPLHNLYRKYQLSLTDTAKKQKPSAIDCTETETIEPIDHIAAFRARHGMDK